MTQFEVLKNKDIYEMAAFLADCHIEQNPKLRKRLKRAKDPVMFKYQLALTYKQYLESEVED